MMMKKSQILSGAELVSRGATKLDVTLPVLGNKDNVPNGSWLEQKQIQSAIEARKHLIEVARIEKRGVISHANWNEELGLVEVTQQAGSYWQWYGHHKNKQLYLFPEEALFLLETNCLLLKYEEVTVSLQQAYSLLLRGPVSLFKYRVYSSLSRIGYKVYRHDNNRVDIFSDESEGVDIETEIVETDKSKVSNENSDLNTDDANTNEEFVSEETVAIENSDVRDTETVENIDVINNSEQIEVKINCETINRKQLKLQKLWKQKHKTINRYKIDKYFENVPDMCEVEVVDIKVPEESLLPRNIFLNKTNYILNLNRIRTTHQPATDNHTYSLSDVNDSNIRRIRGTSRYETNFQNNGSNFCHSTFPRFPQFWPNNQRHRHPGQYNFNVFFQRPFLPQIHFTRLMYWHRNQTPLFPQQRRFFQHHENGNRVCGSRKRSSSSSKHTHLRQIKSIIEALKHIVNNGSSQEQNFRALHHLLNTYNVRYRTRLRLSNEFELINEDDNLETIDLGDDEEPSAKVVKQSNTYDENIANLQQVANTLKELSMNGKASSRHRRAFLNLINTFNKCYKADVYCDYDFKIINKNHIVIDSSESDCIMEEESEPSTSTPKMFINPFNALNKSVVSLTSADEENDTNHTKIEELSRIFKSWLPKENDFGRAEVISTNRGNDLSAYVIQEEYFDEFVKNCNADVNSWNKLKVCFWENISDPVSDDQQKTIDTETCSPGKALVEPGQFHDMTSVLERLRVIETCQSTAQDTNLHIDFDVYNRDVSDFRKSSKPTPHFRVLCVRENSPVTSGEDIATLYSKYSNTVPIVFAIVGSGSISYLQMKPSDLPVYIPTNDAL